MSLVELGRFDAQRSQYRDRPAGVGRHPGDRASTRNASIADGSQFFIPVRVMVDDEDADAARRIIADAA